MTGIFNQTIVTLVSALVAGCPGDSASRPATERAVAAFVLEQYRSMPSLLRYGFCLVTFVFSFWSIRRLRLFHLLNPQNKLAQVVKWRESRYAVCRDFIRFCESFSLMGWYSLYEPSRKQHHS